LVVDGDTHLIVATFGIPKHFLFILVTEYMSTCSRHDI